MSTSHFDSYYFNFHSPTHLNTGNYFIGVLMGYFYYQFKESGGRHRQSAFFHGLWHFCVTSTFLLCIVGIYFYENDVEKGIFTALLGALFKHIYAPILGVIVVGIFFRYGLFIPKMFNYGFYRILARMSFSVYMVHVTIASIFITGQKFPLEVNNATLASYAGIVYLFR